MAYERSRVFRDNIGQLVSLPDLELFWDNTALMDELSYRSMDLFPSSGGSIGGTPGLYNNNKLPITIWAGYLRYRSAMTTLYIEFAAAPASNEVLRIYLNGATPAAAVVTPIAGSWTTTIDLTGRGYTDSQVVRIDVKMEANAFTGDISEARYVVREVAAGPVPKPVDSWPGVPTFTTTPAASSLNGLANAIDWLWRRMKLVPIPAGMLQLYASGPCGNRGLDPTGVPLGFYGVRRNYAQDKAYIRGQVLNMSSPQLRAFVQLNGVTVWTGATWGPGPQTLNAEIDLSSISVGAVGHLSLYAQVLSAGPNATWKNSRWSFNTRATPNLSSAPYPYASMPAYPIETSDYTTTEFRDWLNALGAVVSATKARLDATPWVWDRVRAMRRYYAWVEKADDLTWPRAIPRFERAGQRLFVSGKDISIVSGDRTVPTSEKGSDWEHYAYEKKESVLGGETRGQATVQLANYTWLPAGTSYGVLSPDTEYAEELL